MIKGIEMQRRQTKCTTIPSVTGEQDETSIHVSVPKGIVSTAPAGGGFRAGVVNVGQNNVSHDDWRRWTLLVDFMPPSHNTENMKNVNVSLRCCERQTKKSVNVRGRKVQVRRKGRGRTFVLRRRRKGQKVKGM